MIKYSENLIPIMTSNTTPSGVSSASSVFGVDFEAWKAFDGDKSNIGWQSANGSIVAWLSFKFESPKIISKYAVSCYTENAYAITRLPKKWTFEGSNDGTNWTILDTQVNQINWKLETREYFFENDSPYIHYRINISENNGSANYTLISELEMFSVTVNKILFKDDNGYKFYSIDTNEFRALGETITEETYLNLGISDLSVITEQAWQSLVGNVELLYYTDDSAITEVQYSIETDTFTLSDELGDSFSIIEYTDNPTQDDSVITAETEPYSVYDYISENPEVLVYTESNDDVTVETTTEPFTIYDEFGDEVEVLHYTDDTSVTETDLILEANWSPIDELDGDFEVVTWTNEIEETNRILDLKGIPSPKLVRQLDTVSIGSLLKVLANDLSNSEYKTSNLRFLFTNNNTNWFNFKNGTFNNVNVTTNESIRLNGNTSTELISITEEEFKTWTHDSINVGIYMEDDIRDNVISKVDSPIVTHESYVDSPVITGNSLYILNTTAMIDIELIGNSVFGTLSDADMSRVQYRVKLNDKPYFPVDGEYTTLAESPQAISINFTSSEIKIDDWNDVVIEFKDYFGKEDSWSARFIGRYSGILFRDENGENYSTDVGAILKYLDFGTVITGQFTPVYKVMLKNTYGFDVKELKLEANTEGFPEGLVVEFDTEQEFTNPRPSLTRDFLANEEESPFYIRMNSPINTQPNGANYFDIYVSAKRDV